MEALVHGGPTLADQARTYHAATSHIVEVIEDLQGGSHRRNEMRIATHHGSILWYHEIPRNAARPCRLHAVASWP